MGARGLCKAEVGVRFPSPPSPLVPLTVELREAVRKVLGEPGHAARAAAMQAEMAGHGGARHAGDLQLAGVRPAALSVSG